jgi:hypothetical protein
MQPDPHASTSRGHESSTVSLRGVIIFVVVFVITAAVLNWLIWILYRAMIAHEERGDEPTSALVSDRPTPPEPQLQPFGAHGLPQQDMAALRAMENVEFAKRGWTDAQTGTVRVPDAILERVVRAAATTRPTTTQPQGQ